MLSTFLKEGEVDVSLFRSEAPLIGQTVQALLPFGAWSSTSPVLMAMASDGDNEGDCFLPRCQAQLAKGLVHMMPFNFPCAQVSWLPLSPFYS